MTGLLIASLVTSGVLLLDNLRLRLTRSKNVKAINILGGGLIMPLPDDPRWKPGTSRFYRFVEYDANNKAVWKWFDEETLIIGDIIVNPDHSEVYLKDTKIGGYKAWRYSRAVRFAHRQQLALAAIESDT